jgi:hypothetical protein
MFDYTHEERGEDRPHQHQYLAGEEFFEAWAKINQRHFDDRGAGRSWFWIRVIRFLIMNDYGVFWWAKEMKNWRTLILKAQAKVGRAQETRETR